MTRKKSNLKAINPKKVKAATNIDASWKINKKLKVFVESTPRISFQHFRCVIPIILVINSNILQPTQFKLHAN